jgi:hypothetical protein
MEAEDVMKMAPPDSVQTNLNERIVVPPVGGDVPAA